MHFILYASLIITTISQFTLSNVAKSLTSYSTLRTGVTYELNFTMTKTITAGSSVMLTFGSEYRIPNTSLANCKASRSSGIAPASAACTSSYASGLDVYSIIYTDIYTTGGAQSFLRLMFDITNPWGATSSRIDVYIKDTLSATLESTTFFIDYTASSLSTCSFKGITDITGDNVTQTVKFTPSMNLIAGSYLVVTMPFWFIGALSNLTSTSASTITCTGLTNTDVSSLPCSLAINDQSLQILTINNFVSSNKTSPGEISIKVDTLKNPWSTQPFGQIIFEIYYTGLIVTQKCIGVYQTATIPNSFKASSINITATEISAANNIVQVILVVQNPNPKNMSRLRIEYSNQITFAWGGVNAATVLSQNSTQTIFTNIATNDRTSGSINLIGFTVTTPPSTRPFTFKFTTEYITASNNVYDIDTASKTFQNNPGAITGGLVTVTDPTINVITSYKIDFTLKNKMVSGGFIQIIFPATISIDPTATCTVNITNYSSCVINSGNITININGSVPVLSALSVIVDKVKNAAESIQSGTFKMYSYYDSLYNSLIDKIESGITVTMIANLITVAQVTPSNLTTYTVTSYKFDFTLKDNIAQNGYIELEFPTGVVPVSGSISIVASSFSASTCTLGLTGQIIKINNCFLSGPMTTMVTSITIGGIQNPQSYKPTNTFKVRTYSGLPSLTNYISTGITTQMTTAYVLSTFSITPQSSIVHTDTKQTINIVHTIPLAANDYVIINFDSTMMISASVSCAGVVGITGVNCVRVSNTQLKVIYASGISSQTLSYDATSVMNYDVAQTAINFDATVYASDNFIKQKALTSFTYVQAAISTFSVNNDDKIILDDYSQITLTLSTPFMIGSSFNPTLTMLQVIMPAGITTAANTTCAVLSGTCTNPVNTKLQVTSIGLGVTSFSIVLTNILLPLISVQSGSFTITFYYNSKKVSTVSTGVVITPYCTSPCKACSVTKTKCLNCLPAPNTLVYYDQVGFTCLTVCLDGTYPDSNKICQNCVAPCNTCLDSTKCLTCVAGTWLSGQTCVNPCPDTFYNGATGTCLACQDPCNKCRTQTQCLSCKTGFYYNFSCLTASNCPSGTYANTTTLNCQACQLPCSTCLNLQNNCTSCVAPYFFYDNLCSNSCPSSMYQSGSFCLNCTGLCSTCQNATYCLSCTSNYYYNGSCIVASSCPLGTYANATEMKCKTCPSGCTSCESLVNCTSCDTTFYIFYQYQCITRCPDGTYKSGFTCQDCSSPCQNCQNTSTTCLSCRAGTYLYLSGCPTQCPRGYYEDVNVCKTCKPQCADCVSGSSCIQCSGSLFLTVSGQCLNTCPSGYYKNTINNKCQACLSPCSQCSLIPTNCTSCISSRVLYQNDCSSSGCPAQYFNVSGQCKTCNNCDNCLSADQCDNCRAGYFLFGGVCYLVCPATAPIQDLLTQTCTLCDATCQMCAVSAKNCTSCNAGKYFFNSACYDSCPSGYVQNVFQRSCSAKQLSSIFYFPTMFATLAILVILLYGKVMYRETQFVTILTAVVSIFCFISWIVYFIVMYFFEISLDKQMVSLFSILALAVIGLSVLLGIGYQVYLRCAYDCDGGYSSWMQHDSLNSRFHKVIVAGSLISFIFYRFVYSRLFHREYFSLCYADGQRLLTHTHRLALLTIFFQLLPIVGISFYTVYKKQIYDQTVYSALDTLVINVILIILLLIQGSKSGQEYFGEMKKKLPFIASQTKGKYLEVDSSMSIAELNDQEVVKEKGKGKRLITQIAQKDKENYFRRITCIQNLNKFGHLNQVTPKQQEHTKSLPQQNLLKRFPQFSLQQEDQIQVMDDLFFEEKQQDQYKQQHENLKQQQQQQQLGGQIQDQEIIQQQEQQKLAKQVQLKRKKQEQQKQQLLKIQRQREEQLERQEQQRLAKLLQDQLQQQNLQCVDLAAIDKAQSRNKTKKSPLDFLSKCKTVDDKPIDDKAAKKLQDIAKKNGINPDFMKQTFGVQKHHNQQLLNSIIDKHHHVNRQAVKEMFKQTNNKEVLQQLFSKGSTVDTQKLKALMNDKDGVQMIQKLMDQQKGIVSPDVAKALFDKNSKFKPQFTKKLLSGQSGADQKKLQQLLRDGQNQKTKEQNLKALKKIGGQNLQNTQLIEKMLGQKSSLDPTQFTKVANSLSAKALQSIFTNKSPQNTKLVDKVLNNKKLDMRALSPIFQDDQLIYELGKKLGGDDPILQQNIMNLLKNCGQNTDPQKLKEFLQNQVLVKKLMQNSIIDPQFLTEILSKDSKANLQLIEKTINEMPEQDIQRVFEFTGDKNIDYKSISKIFQQNDKTDPELVKKMLDPQLIEEVFTKNNNVNANMLQKLVQKGSKFDKDNIVNIYGKNTNNPFGEADGNFDKQGRMTNRTKNKNGGTNNDNINGNDADIRNGFDMKNGNPMRNGSGNDMRNGQASKLSKHEESIIQSIKNGPFSQLMKNQSFSKMMKDGSLTQIIKNGSTQDILKDQTIQQMLKDGSFGQIMKNVSNGQAIKAGNNGQTIKFGSNGEITKIGPKGESISVDQNGNTILIGSNGQTIKIGQNGQITIIGTNGQVLKKGSYQQMMEEGILEEMINNGTFGQMTKNSPIGQMIRNGTLGQFLQNGSLAQIIKNQAYQQVIKNGAFTQILKNGPLGQIITNQDIQQSIKNGTYQENVKNGSFGEIFKTGSLGAVFRNDGTIYDPNSNQTEYDFRMAFNKTANQNFNMSENGQPRPQQMQQMIMSRTDGGMMGFLNPLKLKEKKKKFKQSMKEKDEWDDLGQRLQNLDEDSDQEQGYGNDKAILEEQQEDGFAQHRRRKAPIKRRKLKKITDIRHPAQKIYLEPILAPHQIQQSKSFRKKKKRDQSQSATKLIMDEDNDVFDIDF